MSCYGMVSYPVHGMLSVRKIHCNPDQQLLNINTFYFDDAHLHCRRYCWLLTRAQKAISQAISSRTFRINVNKACPLARRYQHICLHHKNKAMLAQCDFLARRKQWQLVGRSTEIIVLTGSL